MNSEVVFEFQMHEHWSVSKIKKMIVSQYVLQADRYDIPQGNDRTVISHYATGDLTKSGQTLAWERLVKVE